MKIMIYPCPGMCNVSMMTKTVAYSIEIAAEDLITVLPNIAAFPEEFNVLANEGNTKCIAVNGCPSRCASKAFDVAGIDTDDEVVITKNFDPKNNEKYAELLNIDEEVAMVQSVIDRVLKNN